MQTTRHGEIDENQQSSTTKRKLLVVDDDLDFLLGVKTFFNSYYDVQIARGGMAALKLIANGYRPDCMLVDTHMFRNFEGVDFIKSLYFGDLDLSHMRVALCSGMMDKEISDRVVGYDVACFIKPFNTKEILDYFEGNSS